MGSITTAVHSLLYVGRAHSIAACAPAASVGDEVTEADGSAVIADGLHPAAAVAAACALRSAITAATRFQLDVEHAQPLPAGVAEEAALAGGKLSGTAVRDAVAQCCRLLADLCRALNAQVAEYEPSVHDAALIPLFSAAKTGLTLLPVQFKRCAGCILELALNTVSVLRTPSGCVPSAAAAAVGAALFSLAHLKRTGADVGGDVVSTGAQAGRVIGQPMLASHLYELDVAQPIDRVAACVQSHVQTVRHVSSGLPTTLPTPQEVASTLVSAAQAGAAPHFAAVASVASAPQEEAVLQEVTVRCALLVGGVRHMLLCAMPLPSGVNHLSRVTSQYVALPLAALFALIDDVGGCVNLLEAGFSQAQVATLVITSLHLLAGLMYQFPAACRRFSTFLTQYLSNGAVPTVGTPTSIQRACALSLLRTVASFVQFVGAGVGSSPMRDLLARTMTDACRQLRMLCASSDAAAVHAVVHVVASLRVLLSCTWWLLSADTRQGVESTLLLLLTGRLALVAAPTGPRSRMNRTRAQASEVTSLHDASGNMLFSDGDEEDTSAAANAPA
ncbi:MAG: hypothetical protein EOO41_02965, partial [Methanobacteriota archaeon]